MRTSNASNNNFIFFQLLFCFMHVLFVCFRFKCFNYFALYIIYTYDCYIITLSFLYTCFKSYLHIGCFLQSTRDDTYIPRSRLEDALYIYIYLSLSLSIYLSIHIHIYVYVYVCIYIYICTYTYTHTHVQVY